MGALKTIQKTCTKCGETIRGLLCTWCNVGIGYFKDNKATLLSAIGYLNRTEREV